MPQFEHFRGDVKRLEAVVAAPYDADAVLLFALKPVDLIVPADTADDNAVLKKDLKAADATDNGDGTVTYALLLSPSDTDSLTPGTYRAEFSYVDGGGNPITFEQFDYIISADINQRA